jgi:hypothetical protein
MRNSEEILRTGDQGCEIHDSFRRFAGSSEEFFPSRWKTLQKFLIIKIGFLMNMQSAREMKIPEHTYIFCARTLTSLLVFQAVEVLFVSEQTIGIIAIHRQCSQEMSSFESEIPKKKKESSRCTTFFYSANQLESLPFPSA